MEKINQIVQPAIISVEKTDNNLVKISSTQTTESVQSIEQLQKVQGHLQEEMDMFQSRIDGLQLRYDEVTNIISQATNLGVSIKIQ